MHSTFDYLSTQQHGSQMHVVTARLVPAANRFVDGRCRILTNTLHLQWTLCCVFQNSTRWGYDKIVFIARISLNFLTQIVKKIRCKLFKNFSAKLLILAHLSLWGVQCSAWFFSSQGVNVSSVVHAFFPVMVSIPGRLNPDNIELPSLLILILEQKCATCINNWLYTITNNWLQTFQFFGNYVFYGYTNSYLVTHNFARCIKTSKYWRKSSKAQK